MGIREILRLLRLSRAVPSSELPSLSLLDWATLTAIFVFCFSGKRLMPLSLVIFCDAMRRSLSAMNSHKLNTPINSFRWKIPATSHSINYTFCCLNYNNLYLSLGNLENGHLRILLKITAMIGQIKLFLSNSFVIKTFSFELRAQDLQRNADALFLPKLMLRSHKNKCNERNKHRRETKI